MKDDCAESVGIQSNRPSFVNSDQSSIVQSIPHLIERPVAQRNAALFDLSSELAVSGNPGRGPEHLAHRGADANQWFALQRSSASRTLLFKAAAVKGFWRKTTSDAEPAR